MTPIQHLYSAYLTEVLTYECTPRFSLASEDAEKQRLRIFRCLIRNFQESYHCAPAIDCLFIVQLVVQIMLFDDSVLCGSFSLLFHGHFRNSTAKACIEIFFRDVESDRELAGILTRRAWVDTPNYHEEHHR